MYNTDIPFTNGFLCVVSLQRCYQNTVIGKTCDINLKHLLNDILTEQPVLSILGYLFVCKGRRRGADRSVTQTAVCKRRHIVND